MARGVVDVFLLRGAGSGFVNVAFFALLALTDSAARADCCDLLLHRGSLRRFLVVISLQGSIVDGTLTATGTGTWHFALPHLRLAVFKTVSPLAQSVPCVRIQWDLD